VIIIDRIYSCGCPCTVKQLGPSGKRDSLPGLDPGRATSGESGLAAAGFSVCSRQLPISTLGLIGHGFE
jgi:hypothetical protein